MILLHDSPNSDLTHIQAIAGIEEGFGLFDYVRIDQQDGCSWIGQVVQPNRNISTVGDRLDPTILHGLRLMQTNANVQSTASVQVFDILVLGQYENRQMLTPRLRPLPGAVVQRLVRDDTITVIGLPRLEQETDAGLVTASNVIGRLLNAEDVPLCFSERLFNYHVMVAGGTGSGKSNAAANLVFQAARARKCILIHDAKPDYGFIERANTDPNVTSIWQQLGIYGLHPRVPGSVVRIGFHGRCTPGSVHQVVGFRSSDFEPEMLAALFFPGTNEQNQYEAFASAAHTLREQVLDQANHRAHYTLDDILNLINERTTNQDTPPRDRIHEATGAAIQRKANSRRRNLPWLDSIGREVHNGRSQSRLGGSRLDGPRPTVQQFVLADTIQEGRIIVIDYSQMDEESYALILSFFLRVCQEHRRQRQGTGIVQLVDEAHRVFDNESRHSDSLARAFSRVMREGRSVDHSIILSLQNASQIPSRVMNNLNTQIVMRQNSKSEAEAATQTMGRDFAVQSMRLGTGHALVNVHESRAVVLAHLAPSPYELMRNDNAGNNGQAQETPQQETLPLQNAPQLALEEDDIPF